MINVYFTSFSTQCSAVDYLRYNEQLPGAIVKKIEKYARWQDAHAAIFGKLLLKKALTDLGKSDTLEELKYTKFQKPYFEDRLDFNISHSGEFVVCAISDHGALGIDIENIKPVDISDFDSQWTLQERNTIRRSADPLRTFYDFWTRKEAVVKADGNGLNVPLYTINTQDSPVILNGNAWYVRPVFIQEHYSCHLASSHLLSSDPHLIEVVF